MKSLKMLWVILWFPLCASGQDVYEIKFTADATEYRAALVLFEDDSARMRVRFHDGQTRVLEQSVTLKETGPGKKLVGGEPFYAGTSIKFPSYNSHDFYLTKDDSGSYSIAKAAEADISDPTIRKIEGEVEISHFLFFFNWKLRPE